MSQINFTLPVWMKSELESMLKRSGLVDNKTILYKILTYKFIRGEIKITELDLMRDYSSFEPRDE